MNTDVVVPMQRGAILRTLYPPPHQPFFRPQNIWNSIVAAVHLVGDGNGNGGIPNRVIVNAAGIPSIIIVIRLTVCYTDNTAADPTQQKALTFKVEVEADDWMDPPCTYAQDDCILFPNDETNIFPPDTSGGLIVLGFEDVNEFTAEAEVSIASAMCNDRCKNLDICDDFETISRDLQPDGDGTLFGTIVQSTLSNGFCTPSIFDYPQVTGLRGQRYDGIRRGWWLVRLLIDPRSIPDEPSRHLPSALDVSRTPTGHRRRFGHERGPHDHSGNHEPARPHAHLPRPRRPHQCRSQLDALPGQRCSPYNC